MLETGHVQDIDDGNIDELVLYLRPYFSQYNYRLEYDFYQDKDDFMKYAKYEEWIKSYFLKRTGSDLKWNRIYYYYITFYLNKLYFTQPHTNDKQPMCQKMGIHP